MKRGGGCFALGWFPRILAALYNDACPFLIPVRVRVRAHPFERCVLSYAHHILPYYFSSYIHFTTYRVFTECMPSHVPVGWFGLCFYLFYPPFFFYAFLHPSHCIYILRLPSTSSIVLSVYVYRYYWVRFFGYVEEAYVRVLYVLLIIIVLDFLIHN